MEEPTGRPDITAKTTTTRIGRALKGSAVAAKAGLGMEGVTAACLGRMALNGNQAPVGGDMSGLTVDERQWPVVPPYRGPPPASAPTNPLLHRFHALVSGCGTPFKERVHEAWGDGTLSAIDSRRHLQREPDPRAAA